MNPYYLGGPNIITRSLEVKDRGRRARKGDVREAE